MRWPEQGDGIADTHSAPARAGSLNLATNAKIIVHR